MNIRYYKDERSALTELFNRSVDENEVVYKKLDEERFDSLFVEENGCGKVICVAYEENEAVGFCAGCRDDGTGRTFISYINVKREYRNKGIGKALLYAAEKRLADLSGGGEMTYEMIFHDPAHLEWYIPSTPKHDHPCAPGVDMDTYAYTFFKHNGYADYAEQLSFYIDLTDYVYPQKVLCDAASLKERGIEITYYDKDVHYGFAEFFDELKHDAWKKAVLSSLDKKILVASDNGRICGYTGPLSVQKSGRGSFNGIGVAPDHRGMGIGTVLFAELCKRLGETGAAFMSLYTGSTNPARFIYGGAGFKIVKHWADLKKSVK